MLDTNSHQIICPKCQTKISIDDVLSSQIESQLRAELGVEKKELEERAAAQAAALSKQQAALQAQAAELAAEKNIQAQKIQAQVTTQLQQKETELRAQIKTQLQEQLDNESKREFALLQEQLSEKTKKLDLAREKELDLRKQANILEERQKELELEVQRKIDAQRAQIEEQASKKATEQEHLKIAELQKQLQDAVKANGDLTRKLQQGSQQNQGEVLELELESTLIHAFPMDEILPVAKGANGADLIQKVHDRLGHHCGTIVWESKQTKNFTEGWISKLKDDQRREKAEFAVLVSTALPKEIENFGARDSIWIANFASVLGLATALRINLLQLHTARQAAVGKDVKMEALYQYITGTEFKQRIEAIVESFTLMRQDLEKEKIAMQKNWDKRAKQLERVVMSTAGLYGNLEGLVGKNLPSIELLELETSSETDRLTATDSLFD